MYHKIVVIDQSRLALNMYRLLLKEEKANFLVASSYQDARPWFFNPGKIDLVIINSNIFGSKFDIIYEQLLADEPLDKLPKLFIYQEQENERQKKLQMVSKAWFLKRPFHPDEFLKISLNILKAKKK
ncbi:MAG: hypothetical protein ABH859_05920 [Pseudomonadota bacterium]